MLRVKKLRLILPLLLILASFVRASDNWWNPDWKYRKNIEVTENAGLDRIEEPVSIWIDVSANPNIIDCAKEFRLIFNDLEVDFNVIEEIYSGSDCQSAKIEFMATVNAYSSKTYSVYYGNPAAIKPDIKELNPFGFANKVNSVVHFFEGSGSLAGDATSNNNTITFMNPPNQPAWTTESRFGKYAVKFDGRNDTLSTTTDYWNGKNDSIEMWLHLKSYNFLGGTGWGVIFDEFGGPPYVRRVTYNANGKIRFDVNGAGVWSSQTLPLNNWFHFLYTCEKKADGHPRHNIYVDGVEYLTWTEPWTTRGCGSYYSNSVTGIGNQREYPAPDIPTGMCDGCSINGTIDEFRYYPKRLTPDDTNLRYHTNPLAYLVGPEETGVVGCDLEVMEIKPVQVVYDADLVEDKSTVTRVKIRNNGPNSCKATAKLTYPEISINNVIKTLDSGKEEFFDFYFTPPTKGQNIQIQAEVFADITDPKPNNNYKIKYVNVKETKKLFIGYMPLVYNSAYPTDYSKTVEKSGKFINSTYPVGAGFTNKLFGTEISSIIPILDEIKLYRQGYILSDRKADRIVGVAPSEYFDYHFGDPNMGGLSKVILGGLTSIHGVIIQDGYWTAAAHEIGHTYGLPVDTGWCFSWESGLHSCEEYEVFEHGRLASGFWVEEKDEVQDGICFMGTQTEKYHWIGPENKLRWVDNQDYEYILDKLKINYDPEVLLVSGIIYKNDKVEALKWYRFDNGTVSYIVPGNYSIKILDETGSVLTEVWFDARFPVVDGVEIDFTGFAFTISYPEETATVQVTYQEEVLAEIIPTTKLLHDAVDLVPDYGFVNNPEQGRNALHHKINAVHKMLEERNKRGAKNKLEKDIKDKLEKWLIIYEKENVLQFTKEEIIALVDNLIEKL